MDKETLIDDLEQVLDDSMDIDWNTRVGAEYIADYLLKEGHVKSSQGATNEQ
jgi:hypothetical protein